MTLLDDRGGMIYSFEKIICSFDSIALPTIMITMTHRITHVHLLPSPKTYLIFIYIAYLPNLRTLHLSLIFLIFYVDCQTKNEISIYRMDFIIFNFILSIIYKLEQYNLTIYHSIPFYLIPSI